MKTSRSSVTFVAMFVAACSSATHREDAGTGHVDAANLDSGIDAGVSDSGPADGGAPVWRPIPIRSQAQKDANMPGGEGFQVILSIAYGPSDPNIIYFGSDTSQVWKSIDGGRNWVSKRNGFRALGGGSVAVDPRDPNTVFVAGARFEADISSGYVSSPANGIYRTWDGGENWQRVYQTDYYGGTGTSRWDSPRVFVFDPDSFDGVRHLALFAGTHTGGLLKSTDGGSTWAQMVSGTSLDRMRIDDLELHKSGTTAMLHVVADNRNGNGIPDSAVGLYKVTDDGSTSHGNYILESTP